MKKLLALITFVVGCHLTPAQVATGEKIGLGIKDIACVAAAVAMGASDPLIVKQLCAIPDSEIESVISEVAGQLSARKVAGYKVRE